MTSAATQDEPDPRPAAAASVPPPVPEGHGPPSAAGAAAAPARAPAAPAPAAAVATGRMRLHPRQVRVWQVGWGIGVLVLAGMVLGAELVLASLDDLGLPWPRGVAAAVVVVVGAAVAWWAPTAAYRRWTYELASTTLELRRGVLVHRHTAIPYFRVQHIDVTRSPIERALGLSQLVVRTAAATTDATIPGVAAAEAEQLRDVILARTGRDDAV